jgi:hypothetical protein
MPETTAAIARWQSEALLTLADRHHRSLTAAATAEVLRYVDDLPNHT